MRELDRYCELKRPEFVVVYGRRRVGKTYLIREYFHGAFSFYATGVAGRNKASQLAAFCASLKRYGGRGDAGTWLEAFEELRVLLEDQDVARDAKCGKRVVFIDELPWLDTQHSGFLTALDFFWNSWGSAQEELLLIVCGSATSWIVENLFANRGGLHNRVTGRIFLEPFTLGECEQYYRANEIELSRREMIESYMVFGGIPFYLDLLDRRLGLAQNIDRLCFSKKGQLRGEFEELFRSLFRKADRHIAIVRALHTKGSGATREEIIGLSGIGDGGALSTNIEELEQCGFIRSYRDFTRTSRGKLYQLIDPFTLFWLRFVEGSADEHWWSANYGSARLRAWSGRAFELACLLHVPQMLRALGVWGVSVDACAWRSKKSSLGAQIDLVLDRADGVVNLCEMKFSDGPFAIDKACDASLRAKRSVFAEESKTRKALHITMVCPYGIGETAYRWTPQSVITGDDLFAL
ncbi:ATP-binding protein [Coriobacteriales bacterium OH1046]|nr:ATP-binding protein [Coriobacteriales bacterium OH1046]